ncbi:hypothetical protein BDV11DRAFT_191494 [Aspergillus similis]
MRRPIQRLLLCTIIRLPRLSQLLPVSLGSITDKRHRSPEIPVTLSYSHARQQNCKCFGEVNPSTAVFERTK